MKNYKLLKRLLCMFCSIIMVVTICTVGVSARQVPNDESGIMPLWDNIYCMEVALFFSDGEGYATGTAIRQLTSTSIEGTITVYEYRDNDWQYVDSWYKSTTRNSLAMEHSFPVETGVTYKAVFEVTAYTGDIAESASTEHIRVCPQMP